MYLLKSLLSTPVSLYLTSRWLFACVGEIPIEGLPSMAEIQAEAFAVQRAVCTVPRVDNISHLEGVAPPSW